MKTYMKTDPNSAEPSYELREMTNTEHIQAAADLLELAAGHLAQVENDNVCVEWALDKVNEASELLANRLYGG